MGASRLIFGWTGPCRLNDRCELPSTTLMVMHVWVIAVTLWNRCMFRRCCGRIAFGRLDCYCINLVVVQRILYLDREGLGNVRASC